LYKTPTNTQKKFETLSVSEAKGPFSLRNRGTTHVPFKINLRLKKREGGRAKNFDLITQVSQKTSLSQKLNWIEATNIERERERERKKKSIKKKKSCCPSCQIN
jgi:hypothetical protein